jgi:hypothetical protein
VFSILMNRVDMTAARVLQDRIVATIARYGEAGGDRRMLFGHSSC